MEVSETYTVVDIVHEKVMLLFCCVVVVFRGAAYARGVSLHIAV